MPKINDLPNLSLDSADSQDLYLVYDPNSIGTETQRTITGRDLRRSIFRDGESDIGAALTGGNGIDITGNTISLAESGEFTGNLDVGGDVVIQGDLTVQGTNTILNTAELTVEDKLITIANGADSTAADGGGMVIGTTGAQMTYRASDDTLVFTKDLEFPNQDGGAVAGVEAEEFLDVGQLNWNRIASGTAWFLTSEENIKMRTVDSASLAVPGIGQNSEPPYIWMNTGTFYTGTGHLDTPPEADSARRGGLKIEGAQISTWQPHAGEFHDSAEGAPDIIFHNNVVINERLETEGTGRIYGQFADSSIGYNAFKNMETLTIYDSSFSAIKTVRYPGQA